MFTLTALCVLWSQSPSIRAQEKKDQANSAEAQKQDDKDPTLDKLIKAREKHTKTVEEARKKLLDALDDKVQAAANKGDLREVEKYHQAKESFEKEDIFPNTFKDAAILGIKGQMDTTIRLANATLNRAFADAIIEYTKAKKIDQAHALREEQKDFLSGTTGTRVRIKERRDAVGLKYLYRGVAYLGDRDYLVRTYPKEMHRAVLLARPAEQLREWLPPFKVIVSRDCTAYVAIMWEYNGKVEAPETFFDRLQDEGWTLVEGPFDVTSPGGELWKWKVVKKQIKKGEVDINHKIGGKVPAVFMFK
jgi:hypothetical protein